MELTKEIIIALLRAHISQRPGLEFGNYGELSSYRSEMRRITRQLADARALLRQVELSAITADGLKEAFPRAYSGRLTLARRFDGRWALEYCTGQYWPTEYRAAACAVLASALWAYYRVNMPAPIAHVVESWGTWNGNSFDRERSKPVGIHTACELLTAKGGQTYGHISDLFRDGNGKPTLSAGDCLRRKFAREFGRGIQSRWFN